MRAVLAAAFVAAFLVACGGGGGPSMHVCAGESTTPVSVDPDYAPGFVGTYQGTLILDASGLPTVSASGQFLVSRTSANKLSITHLLDGTMIGLPTSATTADVSCMTGVEGWSCGQVTITYSNGVATLHDGDQLDIAMDAELQGCGNYASGTLTITNAYRVNAPALVDGEEAASMPTMGEAVSNALSSSFGR